MGTLTPVKCSPAVTKVSILLHTLGTVCFFRAIYHDITEFHDHPSFLIFGGRFKYLTMINLYFTFAASFYSLCVDLCHILVGSRDDSKRPSMFLQLRDELMSCWVFMLCCSVTILFWGIAFVDLEGIHSAEHEKKSPLLGWYNNFVHTLPLPYTLLTITLVNYEFKPLKHALVKIVLFVVVYLSWMAYCAKVYGFWAYKFLQKLPPPAFLIFICVAVLLLFLIQLCGRFLAGLVWNENKLNRKQGKHH